MTTLHMQTENVRSTARQMTQTAAQAEAQLQSLQRALQGLESAWQGGSSEEFFAEAREVVLRLQSQRELLDVLAGRVEREATEWEQVDQRGASMNGDRLGWVNALPNQAVPFSAGGNASYLLSVAPVATALSIGSFFSALPGWLSSFLDRFFVSPEIASPISDGPAPSSPESTTTPTSGFGELLKESPTATPSVETPSTQTVYDQYYDVPTKSQGNLYGNAACAPTSVSMVLDFLHAQNPDLKTASPTDLIGMLDKGDGTPGSGIGLHRLNDDLGELGYDNITVKSEAGFDDLSTALKDGPVIVTAGVKLIGGDARDIQQAGSTIHALVVKGINADLVVLNDPWSGTEKVFSRDTFSQMWANGENGMYAIRP